MFENNNHIFILILITSMINIYYLVNIFNVLYNIEKVLLVKIELQKQLFDLILTEKEG